jgi:CRP-like cAMP-binding protein
VGGDSPVIDAAVLSHNGGWMPRARSGRRAVPVDCSSMSAARGSASSFGVLRAYLEARASFTEDEFALVSSVFVPATLDSGDFLQRAGEVAKQAAFVAHGCLRSYVIDAKGKEHIVQFAPETWWLADSVSMSSGTPSEYFVDAIENSDLLLIDPAGHFKLIQEIPGYARSFQAGIQKHAAVKDRRIVNALSASAEERYLAFLETYPSIVQRVPQWMLASYLGISPETLSRIRKNLSRKK